jgi:aconitate hydratase
VVVERGENLVPPTPPGPLPDEIDARVLIVVPDDTSTGDMAPDGVLAMSVWSNLAACAELMFRRLDPEFVVRAGEWGGGLIVGGHNYGQGSSREHAALAPVHLGVRAIIAGSYARIHRRNLIAVGVVPLEIGDGDRAATAVGQRWHIRRLGDAVRSGADTVVARVEDGREVPLVLRLSLGERTVLAAGGLLAHVRAGGRPRLSTP